jgi:hypothetical protein
LLNNKPRRELFGRGVYMRNMTAAQRQSFKWIFDYNVKEYDKFGNHNADVRDNIDKNTQVYMDGETVAAKMTFYKYKSEMLAEN